MGAACTTGQTFVDGYPVGEPFTCPSGCAREIATAIHWLDRTRPDHPVLDGVELHEPDYRTPTGGRLLTTRSGSMFVAVFRFGDGSRGAVQVGCGIGVDPNPCYTSPPGPASEITIEPSDAGSEAP